ncbi:MAG: hypothetical protein ACI3Z7_04505 [Candidatus Aphodosoma sp.]
MKQTTVLFALLLAAIYLVAVPADPTPRQLVQPNGDTITVRLVGDEFGHWHETLDGNIIIRNSREYWVYATVVDDKLVPSEIVVTNDTANPDTLLGDQNDVRKFVTSRRSGIMEEHFRNRRMMDSIINKQEQKTGKASLLKTNR